MVALGGWMNRQQQDVSAYLKTENRILGEQLGVGGKRVLLDEQQKCRLAAAAAKLGKEHPDTLEWENLLATALLGQSKFAEVEQLMGGILEAEQRVFGKEHLETLRCRFALAMAFDGQGRLDLAAQLYQQTLSAFQRVLGREHFDTLACMQSLADCLQRQGKSAEASRLRQEADWALAAKKEQASTTRDKE